jgi:hypothetical protein
MRLSRDVGQPGLALELYFHSLTWFVEAFQSVDKLKLLDRRVCLPVAGPRAANMNGPATAAGLG